MKMRFLKVLVLAVTALGMSEAVKAADWSDSKYGNDITSILYSSGTPTDKQTVYLYNVGAKKFLTDGGYWGTEGVLADLGLPCWIKNTGTNRNPVYSIMLTSISVKKYFGYVSDGSTKGFYTDSGEGNWNITYSSIDKTITLYSSGAEGYLSCDSKTFKTTSVSSVSNDYAKWKIITKKDFIDDFSAVTSASYENRVDASFYISNPNFSRTEHILNPISSQKNNPWIVDNTDMIENRSSLYCIGDNTRKDVVSDEAQDKKVEGDETDGQYKDEGSGFTVRNSDVEGGYTSRNVGATVHYNEMYGAYYNMKLNGDVNIHQKINSVANAGTYVLSCKGFNTLGNQKAVLYVKIGNDIISKPLLKVIGDIPYMTEAGIKFNVDDEYLSTVVFTLDKPNTDIEIGIDVSGSADGEFTEFDNFRLYYVALPQEKEKYPVGFDESWTTIEGNYFGTDDKYETVYLKRSFTTAGDNTPAWNSIVLPFDLTAGQVKEAFGSNVKLAALSGLNAAGYKIEFNKVDLSYNNATGIVKGKPYIIKVDNNYANITLEGSVNIKSGKGDDYVALDAPYIALASVKVDVADIDDNTELLVEGTSESNAGDGINFYGTYIYRDASNKVIGTNKNIYAYSGGNLVHYQRDITLKGFRGWLEFVGNQENAKKLSVTIDGITDETTGIDDIFGDSMLKTNANGNVYSISGQRVLANGVSLEELPKGVYIMNNKKYIVK